MSKLNHRSLTQIALILRAIKYNMGEAVEILNYLATETEAPKIKRKAAARRATDFLEKGKVRLEDIAEELMSIQREAKKTSN